MLILIKYTNLNKETKQKSTLHSSIFYTPNVYIHNCFNNRTRHNGKKMVIDSTPRVTERWAQTAITQKNRSTNIVGMNTLAHLHIHT